MAGRPRSNGDAPTRGEVVENWCESVFALDIVDEDYYDAASEEGKNVQIKGCKRRIKNGWKRGEQQYANGRFVVWSGDHQRLLEDEDAWYLLVVYEEMDLGEGELEAVAHRFIHPEEFDEYLPEDEDGWHDIQATVHGCPGKGDKYRVSWPKVFPEVDR